MSLKRRGGRFYFYRSQRRGGRVRSIYEGAGVDALLLARMAEFRTDDRETRQFDRLYDREQMASEDRAVAAMDADVEAVASAYLMASGYRRDARGAWRWRGETGPPVADAVDAGTTAPRDPATLKALIALAAATDEAGLTELATCFGGGDRGSAVVAACGSPAGWLPRFLAGRLRVGGAPDPGGAVEELALLLPGLLEDDPSPVRRLVAERVAFYAVLLGRFDADRSVSGLTRMEVADRRRRFARGWKRFSRAVEALDAVRKAERR